MASGETRAPVVRIARGDARGFDALDVDAIAVLAFAVRKQPLGAAGYLDWRLAGRIGRMIRDRKFTGASGEALLMSALGRVGAKRVFLLGLGAPEELASDAKKDELTRAMDVLLDAGARVVAVAPPVLPGEPVAVRESLSARKEAATARPAPSEGETSFAARAMIAWLQASARAKGRFQELLLLDAEGRLELARAPLMDAAKRSGLTWQ